MSWILVLLVIGSDGLLDHYPALTQLGPFLTVDECTAAAKQTKESLDSLLVEVRTHCVRTSSKP